MRRSTAIMAMYEPEEQSGENLQFERAKGGYFSVLPDLGLQVVGATGQDGTPTPDAPVPIQCVKAGTKVQVCGKNLWLRGDVVIKNASNYTISFSPLAPGTYTISANVTSTNETASTNRINLYDESLTLIIEIQIPRGVKSSVTFNLETECYYARFWSGANAAGSDGQSATFTDIQIELGSEGTPHEPFYDGGTVTTPCDLYEGDIWWPMTGKVRKCTELITLSRDFINKGVWDIVNLSDVGGVVKIRWNNILRSNGYGFIYATTTPQSTKFNFPPNPYIYGNVHIMWERINDYFGVTYDEDTIIDTMKNILYSYADNDEPIRMLAKYRDGYFVEEHYPPQPIHAPAGVVNVLQSPAELPATLSTTMLVKGGLT